jgi:UDP-N-acetylmuramyl tripeptide synthase
MAIVDYAHTPDALENVLKTTTSGLKRTINYGCGLRGNRDKTNDQLWRVRLN